MLPTLEDMWWLLFWVCFLMQYTYKSKIYCSKAVFWTIENMPDSPDWMQILEKVNYWSTNCFSLGGRYWKKSVSLYMAWTTVVQQSLSIVTNSRGFPILKNDKGGKFSSFDWAMKTKLIVSIYRNCWSV